MVRIRNLLGIPVLTALLSAGCASLPDNSGRSESYALKDTDGTMLGRAVAMDMKVADDKDGFVLLGNGLDAFVARAVLANLAERSLDVQYYLYHNDQVGKLFTGFLVNAA